MSTTSDKTNKNKMYKFIEHLDQYGIIYAIGLVLFIFFLNKILLHFETPFGLNSVDVFFSKTIPIILTSKDSTLITIAAVFIGIYFTVFTLLTSIGVESTFAILTRDNFDKLVKYISRAFFGSFIYLFFSLFYDVFPMNSYFSIISLSLLLYMLLSALRFASIIYLIFTQEVKKYYERLEEEKRKQRELDSLYKRLNNFLLDEELKKQTKYSREFSKKLDERLQNKSNS